MKNTEKQDYLKDILKKIKNKDDDLALSTLKTHLAHWVNQYFHFQRDSKSLRPNCISIEAIGCIKATACALKELDKKNEIHYNSLNHFVESSVKAEIDAMDNKYSKYWRNK